MDNLEPFGDMPPAPLSWYIILAIVVIVWRWMENE